MFVWRAGGDAGPAGSLRASAALSLQGGGLGTGAAGAMAQPW